MSLRTLCLGAIVCQLAGTVSAAPLTLVTVSAPDINCVFDRDCSVVVSDSFSYISLPATEGTARLQSRIFRGEPGAPGDGKTAYEYRVDLTQATALGDAACVTALDVEFGPIAKLQYNKAGPADDVFIVTKGGVGSIGLASAEQDRKGIVTFTFAQPVCAADTSSAGQTSFFFGLASVHPPKAIVAVVEGPGFDSIDVRARAPKH